MRVGMTLSTPTPSGSAQGSSPMAPSARRLAQKRRKAMLLSATCRLWGLLVKAMRQLTQSVKVVVSVSAGRGGAGRQQTHASGMSVQGWP